VLSLGHEEVALEFKGNAAVKEFSSLLKGESPRGVAIVCAAFFDETIGVLLGDKKDRAFFDRIVDARDFGLLTSDEHDDLQVLRQLRNHFAHRLKARSFDSSKAKLVDSLKLWRTASSQIQKYKQLFPSPEDRLLYVAAVIAFRLQRRKKVVTKPGPLTEPPFTDTRSWPPAIGR
jgi:hypothetical protein